MAQAVIDQSLSRKGDTSQSFEEVQDEVVICGAETVLCAALVPSDPYFLSSIFADLFADLFADSARKKRNTPVAWTVE